MAVNKNGRQPWGSGGTWKEKCNSKNQWSKKNMTATKDMHVEQTYNNNKTHTAKQNTWESTKIKSQQKTQLLLVPDSGD